MFPIYTCDILSSMSRAVINDMGRGEVVLVPMVRAKKEKVSISIVTLSGQQEYFVLQTYLTIPTL